MAGAMGNAILFVSAMVGVGIVACYVLAYTARCLLVVVTDTAAGMDEVTWPDEPAVDWIGHSLYVGWMVLVWLLPAGLLAKFIPPDVVDAPYVLRLLLLAVPMLWLFFPVGLLASMSAKSSSGMATTDLLGNMVRIAPSMVLFYGLTGLMAWGMSWLWYQALLNDYLYLVPPAALASAAAVLIYARLIGRVGWLIGQQQNPKKKRKAEPKIPAAVKMKIRVADPWDEQGVPRVPKEGTRKKKAAKWPPEDAPNLPVTGYGIGANWDETEAPRPPAEIPLEDVIQPLPEVSITKPEPAAAVAETVNRWPSLDERLMNPEPPPKPPALPLFSGVYDFPWYACSLKAWYMLSFSALVLGIGFRFLIATYPF
jgi:hypothetical protein